MSEHRYDFIQYFTLLTLFAVCPLMLIFLGFNMAIIFGFIIGIASLLVDGYLTKAGLRLGARELNPLFIIFNKKIGEKWMLIFSRFVGGILVLLVALLGNIAILLIVDASFLAVVVANSLTLVSIVSSYDKGNPNIA